MTNTTKEFNLNQRNMIAIAFMFEDAEIRELTDKHLCWLLEKGKFNNHMKDYLRNVYDRFVKESKPLLECVTRGEVIKRTERLWKVNEKLTSVNMMVKEEVINKLDEASLEELAKMSTTLENKIEEFNNEIDEVIKFYESL